MFHLYTLCDGPHLNVTKICLNFKQMANRLLHLTCLCFCKSFKFSLWISVEFSQSRDKNKLCTNILDYVLYSNHDVVVKFVIVDISIYVVGVQGLNFDTNIRIICLQGVVRIRNSCANHFHS